MYSRDVGLHSSSPCRSTLISYMSIIKLIYDKCITLDLNRRKCIYSDQAYPFMGDGHEEPSISRPGDRNRNDYRPRRIRYSTVTEK